jgi:putative transposase
MDQTPREVYGELLSEGTYLASVSTMYRLLREHQQTQVRRAQRVPARYHAPAVRAERPNQVWVWDITRVPGPRAGVWYYVYVILDLYSRYIVGWMVAETENAALAEQLFAETFARYDIQPGTLCVHSDRGAPMTSSLLQDTFAQHAVAPSFSRPKVSNDNPHAEAGFRTMKAQPDMPPRFHNLQEVRDWMTGHVAWNNHQHHHVSLSLFTPADVFFDRVSAIVNQRQRALDQMWNAHPERFPNGRTEAKLPPAFVAIDPQSVYAHGDGWHDTSPLNPLRHLEKHHRMPRPSTQTLLKF